MPEEKSAARNLEQLDDRRIKPRYTCRLRVRMLLPSGQLETTLTRDLSSDGIRVHTDQPIQPGTQLPLILTLFDPVSRNRDDIYLRTLVAYCIHDSTEINFRLGLQILEFAGQGKKKFSEAVDRLANPWAPLHYEDPVLREHSFPLHRRVQLTFGDQPDVSVWTERVSHSTLAISLDKPYQDNLKMDIGMPVILPHTGVIKTINAKAMVAAVRLASGGNISTTLKILNFDQNGKDLFHEELRQRFGAEPPETAKPARAASMLEPIGPWDRKVVDNEEAAKRALNRSEKSKKKGSANVPSPSGAQPDQPVVDAPPSTPEADDDINLDWWR